MNNGKLTKEEEQQLLQHVTGKPARKPLPHRLVLLCLIAAAVIAAAALIIYSVKMRRHEAELAAKKAELAEYRKTFGTIMAENVPKEAKNFPYYQDADVSGSVEWGYSAHYGWNQLKDRVTVTVYADDSFDELSDRSIYNWLQWIYKEYEKRIWKVYDTELKEYKELLRYFDVLNFDAKLKTSDTVSYSWYYTYIIRTSKNTYEYGGMVEDFYTLNGKDHFLRDEQSKWYRPTPTPTPTSAPRPTRKPSGSSGSSGKSGTSGSSGKSGSSGSSGKSGRSGKGFDYYDTYKYDDPEDFWYDYEDDFEDYEDAEDYWEEYH